MNLYIIKAGKAYRTIKNDGLKGLFRVFAGGLAMLKPINKGDCLIVTGGVGDSALYRGYHIAEELSLNGTKTSVAFQDNPFLINHINEFRMFVFHRVLFTPIIDKIVKKIKQQNKRIIFDTDDLVHDPKYLKHMDYYRKMNVFEKKLYENGVGGEFLTDPYIKECTCTTQFLADKLAKFGKKITIVKNKLSTKDLKTVDNNFAKISKDDKIITLGYFSGSASHDKDFAIITEPLLYILNKYKNVVLFIAGPLEIDTRFDKYKKQIVRSGYVSRKKHFRNIARIDINLAPVVIGNPFCEAKSEIKYIEAGICRIPTIASATKTFNFIENELNGFAAENKKQWTRYLLLLINNNKIRKEIGQNAHTLVRSVFTNKKNGGGSIF